MPSLMAGPGLQPPFWVQAAKNSSSCVICSGFKSWSGIRTPFASLRSRVAIGSPASMALPGLARNIRIHSGVRRVVTPSRSGPILRPSPRR